MKKLTFDSGRVIGVTSDTHYSHRNIIQYCLRPWLSDDEVARIKVEGKIRISDETFHAHNEALISNINQVVGSEDILIHAGDVAWGGLNNLKEFRDRLLCKEIYVTLGNHDDDDDLEYVFGRGRVFERFMAQVGPDRAIIEHYPGDSWRDSHKGAWHLFGHVHGVGHNRRMENPSWQLSQDVGVDLHDYKPWLWTELAALFGKRKQRWEDWRKSLRDKSVGGMASDTRRVRS